MNINGEKPPFFCGIKEVCIKIAQKIKRKMSKMRKFGNFSKNFQKGYLQIRFYVVNYGKIK